jgi:hypothetical protein
LLAIAGAGATIGALGLGCGTTRRGGAASAAGFAATGALTGAAGLAGAAVALAAGGRAATASGRCGGALRARSCASFRSRISRIASPGFEMCERSNAGFASTFGFAAAVLPAFRLFR